MGEPIVIAATAAVGKPIVEKLFGKLSDLISLPLNCKSNVQDLKTKVAELEETKISMEESKQVAERRGNEMANGFQKWLNDAGNLIAAANKEVVDVAEEKAKNKCFYRFGGMCLYPVSRYKLSKKAEQNSVSIDQQISKASSYKPPIAHPPAPVRETDTGGKSFEEFPSRGRVLNQIMEELRGGTGVNRIGIHGMAGSGKTTLVKEVKRRLEEEEPDHGFVKVVLAKVTLTPDLKSIQEELARGLGMDLLSGGLTSKQTADTIRAKLSKEMEKGNVLVILDDIWAGIDLEEVGIPGGNCGKLKILTTSRDCNVLEIQMSSQLNFPIGDLEYEEAWRLFEKIVGDKANDPELQPTAIGIVKECGGLPLAVATLAFALRKGISHEWKTVLTKLKNPSPDNFIGEPKVVYTAIEVSYNQLGDEKLQRTFLLCGMMGRNASIEDLLRVGVGLGLFSRGNTVEDSRNELLTLIDNLKAASLLIDGSYDGCLDMHDLIHDVTIAIASKDGQRLLVINDQELEELPDLEAVNGFKWVIPYHVDKSVLPDELQGPQLAFLHIQNKGSSLEIPENFFKRTERLKVLHLKKMHMPSLPSSSCFLENLHTLVLNESVLGDMSIIGKLKSLEILCLQLIQFEELPKEIAELTRLKILDLCGCWNLKVIPPHVLESLSKLEELYLPRSFQRWKLGEHENQENASLAELKHLKKLTTLHIWIGNARMIPKDFSLVNFYRIWIGGRRWYPGVRNPRKSLTLELDLSEYECIESLIKLLLKTATALHLKDSNGVMNAVDELDEGGFQNLKHLSITKASGLQHVFDSSKVFCPNLEELELCGLNVSRIWHTTDFINASSFVENLAELTISNCDNLEYLFSSSMVKGLVKLRCLGIRSCYRMKNVIVGENGEEMEKLIFPKLEFLDVSHVPTLVGFYIGNCNVEFPSLKELKIWNCPNMKGFAMKPTTTSTKNSADIHTLFTKQAKFPRLEQLSIELMKSLNKIWDNQLEDAFCKLSNLNIQNCDFLEEIVGSPKHSNCDAMEQVIKGKESQEIIFHNLKTLKLEDLPNLTKFCSESYLGFPKLVKFSIVKCALLKTFVLSSGKYKYIHAPVLALFDTKVRFPELVHMTIDSLGNLSKIWEDQLDVKAFCKLQCVQVNSCEKLSSVFPLSILEKLQRLHWLSISNCSSLAEVLEFQGHGATQLQARTTTNPTFVDMKYFTFKFPALKYLYLRLLPKLKFFFPQVHTIEFPLLTRLVVRGCDEAQTFASECPSIQSMTGDKQLENLNPWPLFWVTKATFPCLKELMLEWRDMFKEIWGSGQHPGDYFPELDVLKLFNFPEQSVQLPSFFFRSLPNLKELLVNYREISQEDKANSFRQGRDDNDYEVDSVNGFKADIVGCSKDMDAL